MTCLCAPHSSLLNPSLLGYVLICNQAWHRSACHSFASAISQSRVLVGALPMARCNPDGLGCIDWRWFAPCQPSYRCGVVLFLCGALCLCALQQSSDAAMFIVFISQLHPPAMLNAVPPQTWRVLAHWFFEHRYCSIFHHLFYDIFHTCVFMNHVPSLKLLLSRYKFMTAMLEHYDDDDADTKGYIIKVRTSDFWFVLTRPPLHLINCLVCVGVELRCSMCCGCGRRRALIHKITCATTLHHTCHTTTCCRDYKRTHAPACNNDSRHSPAFSLLSANGRSDIDGTLV